MTATKAAKLLAASAFTFVLIMGVVNLFADVTYEGASSINGPFLATLGAGAALIGIISGVGEFLGYSLRSISGYWGDKTRHYWVITIIGYVVNLLAVPALALAGNLPLAAILIIAERVGRAIRKPTVEAMLSYTTAKEGKGWVYGVNTALDQVGATIGPLLIAGVLLIRNDFRVAYVTLLVPAVLALATLLIARSFFANPAKLETKPTTTLTRFTRPYWLYMLGAALFAAGLMSFELIAYHFSRTGVVPPHWIPVFFSVAMGTDAIASLILGRLFDRMGKSVALVAFSISALFAPFVFLGSFPVALFGMVLWGIGFGAQDTLLKAIIASVLPKNRRNLAFGLFYTGYGLGWLVGSVTTGLLYGRSLPLLIIFSVVIQLAALPFFALAQRSS
jgi:MFS family permease